MREHGERWALIAEHLTTRDARAVRQRWQETLSRTRKGLTSAELRRLAALQTLLPKGWKGLADALGSGHTGAQVREVAVRTDPALRKGRWCVDEDTLLRGAVDVVGTGKWAKIARIVGSRSDAACYERWEFSLRPGLVRGKWGAAEDGRLLAAVQAAQKNRHWDFGEVARAVGGGRGRKACAGRYKRLARAT